MVGEKLGSFQLKEVLGTGAMGVVYRAVHETNGKVAAIKVISGEISQRSNTYERFKREAEILQQFRHPNIVRFLAVGRYQGTSYFAMEFVPGKTLDQVLAKRGPLPWREVVDLGIQLCDALHYAHDHGVVHRDLKPSNLMITDKGQLKLTDFGIAKDLDATALTATGRTLGTAAYMAPEQIRGTPAVTHKTDLYALGVVLYQMLTGQTAFAGTAAVVLMHQHLNEPPPRPSAKVAEIPSALDDLVLKLLAKSPTDRPWDAQAVSVTLASLREKASRGESIPMVWPQDGDKAALPSRGEPVVPKKSKKPAAAAPRFSLSRSTVELVSLVVGLVLISGFVGYMLWPSSAGYLYRNAERLMASDQRHDWVEARDEYLEPLDRRFPDNPYRDKTQPWRDKLALFDTESRARILDSPVPTSYNAPKNKGENLFVVTAPLARQASKDGDDVAAASHWEEMARQLSDKEPEERPWALLARKRFDDLKKTIAERHEIVAGLLNKAIASLQAGRPDEALRIRNEIESRFGKYKDLSDVFALSPLFHKPAEPPSPAPAPTPAPAPSSEATSSATNSPTTSRP
jgi:serine/threonine-protein kinase